MYYKDKITKVLENVSVHLGLVKMYSYTIANAAIWLATLLAI